MACLIMLSGKPCPVFLRLIATADSNMLVTDGIFADCFRNREIIFPIFGGQLVILRAFDGHSAVGVEFDYP